MSVENAPRYEPLSRERPLSERVAEQIEESILRGKLVATQQLPSQSELAAIFGVSRTVIREAMKVLQAKGLIEVRPGAPAIVVGIDAENVQEWMSLFLEASQVPIAPTDIEEIRRMLEPNIVALAAERAQPEDLGEMLACIERMKDTLPHIGESGDYREKWAEADLDFHMALARATSNPLIPVLIAPLISVLARLSAMALERPTAPQNAQDAITYHQMIYERIAGGDADGASRVMREHLEQAARVISEVQDAKEFEDSKPGQAA